MIVISVDTPERSRRSYEVIDAPTDADGLVLPERVPAFRARGPGISLGALELADPA